MRPSAKEQAQIFPLDEARVSRLIDIYNYMINDVKNREPFAQDAVQVIFSYLFSEGNIAEEDKRLFSKYENIIPAILDIAFQERSASWKAKCREIATIIIKSERPKIFPFTKDKDGNIIQSKYVQAQKAREEQGDILEEQAEETEIVAYSEEQKHQDDGYKASAYDLEQELASYKSTLEQLITDHEVLSKYYSTFINFTLSHIKRGIAEAIKKNKYPEKDASSFLRKMHINNKKFLVKTVLNMLHHKINEYILRNNITYTQFALIFINRHSTPVGISLDALLRTNIKAVARKAALIDMIMKKSEENLKNREKIKGVVVESAVLEKRYMFIKTGKENVQVKADISFVFDMISKNMNLQSQELEAVMLHENEVYVVTKKPISVFSHPYKDKYIEKIPSKLAFLKEIVLDIVSVNAVLWK